MHPVVEIIPQLFPKIEMTQSRHQQTSPRLPQTQHEKEVTVQRRVAKGLSGEQQL